MARTKKPEPFDFPDEPAMPLRNYDVMVVFCDGSEEVILVQAKHPLAALGTARYAPEREWTQEKLLRVTGAYIVD